jgi:hypothetical protein
MPEKIIPGFFQKWKNFVVKCTTLLFYMNVEWVGAGKKRGT